MSANKDRANNTEAQPQERGKERQPGKRREEKKDVAREREREEETPRKRWPLLFLCIVRSLPIYVYNMFKQFCMICLKTFQPVHITISSFHPMFLFVSAFFSCLFLSLSPMYDQVTYLCLAKQGYYSLLSLFLLMFPLSISVFVSIYLYPSLLLLSRLSLLSFPFALFLCFLLFLSFFLFLFLLHLLPTLSRLRALHACLHFISSVLSFSIRPRALSALLMLLPPLSFSASALAYFISMSFRFCSRPFLMHSFSKQPWSAACARLTGAVAVGSGRSEERTHLPSLIRSPLKTVKTMLRFRSFLWALLNSVAKYMICAGWMWRRKRGMNETEKRDREKKQKRKREYRWTESRHLRQHGKRDREDRWTNIAAEEGQAAPTKECGKREGKDNEMEERAGPFVTPVSSNRTSFIISSDRFVSFLVCLRHNPSASRLLLLSASLFCYSLVCVSLSLLCLFYSL